YRPQDLDVLQQVKHLLYDQGYTIKGARKAIEDFAKARASQPAAEWAPTIPPANVNDNDANAGAYRDTLAEIADALNVPGELEDERIGRWRNVLAGLRMELAATRDELARLLPKANYILAALTLRIYQTRPA